MYWGVLDCTGLVWWVSWCFMRHVCLYIGVQIFIAYGPAGPAARGSTRGPGRPKKFNDGHSCYYFSNWFIILIINMTNAYASVIYELWDKEFLYFPWVCWGMGWIYGWGLFLETNCQYPRLILHNILHINQDFRRGKSTKSIFIWKIYSIPSIKTSCRPVFDICHY